MLIRFMFENFRSFKDQQELNLLAGPLTELDDSLIDIAGSGFRLLPSAAIYGANASGKTNVIRVLAFVSSTVKNSHRNWEPEGPIPRAPFLLNEESPRKSSSFEVEFVLEGVRYRYGFVLNSEAILEEWLYGYPSGKPQAWFRRKATGDRGFVFSRSLTGENRAIEGLTRKNSLYLSAAAQNNHEMLLPLYNYLADGIDFLLWKEPVPVRTLEMCESEKYKSLFVNFLGTADLGITGFRLDRKADTDERMKKFVSNLVSSLKEFAPKVDFSDLNKGVVRPLFLHSARSGSSMELPISDESAGTVAYFSLLGPVFKAIENGTVLCVDELDSSLHPLLALELVKVFNDRERNPLGAQLIFNTHETNLLSASVLRRDQVWFTEKDAEGATHLYPLSDFKPRKNESLERGYLQGRYGAVPFIEPDVPAPVKGD